MTDEEASCRLNAPWHRHSTLCTSQYSNNIKWLLHSHQWFNPTCVRHRSVTHSFISDMHRYECIAPNVDISLQSKQVLWATERGFGFQVCWIVLIHVVQGYRGLSGLVQLSKREGEVKALKTWHKLSLSTATIRTQPIPLNQRVNRTLFLWRITIW